MATTSWTQIVDNAVKLMIFNRFGPFLNLSDANKDLVLAPRQIAQRMIAEKRGAGSTVEFISVWNEPAKFDWARQNSPTGRKGFTMEYTAGSGGSNSQIITIKAVPVLLDYKFCVWSLYLDEIKQVVESYSKWLHDYPNLKIFYSGLFEMDMYLKFGTPLDTTDYDIYEKGKYFVYEFPLTVDGWVLTNILTPTVYKIVLDVYLRQGTAPNYQDIFLEEYIITSSGTTYSDVSTQ